MDGLAVREHLATPAHAVCVKGAFDRGWIGRLIRDQRDRMVFDDALTNECRVRSATRNPAVRLELEFDGLASAMGAH